MSGPVSHTFSLDAWTEWEGVGGLGKRTASEIGGEGEGGDGVDGEKGRGQRKKKDETETMKTTQRDRHTA